MVKIVKVANTDEFITYPDNKKIYTVLQAMFSKKNIILSLCTLVLFTSVVYLGIWQMNRATYKKNLMHEISVRSQTLKKDLENLDDFSLESHRFQAVSIKGILLNDKSILLDNQVLNKKVGFRVLTPLEIDVDKPWVLLDRGWIGLEKGKRYPLPQISSFEGIQEVLGIVSHVPTGLLLGNQVNIEKHAGMPYLMQQLNYEELEQALGHKFYHFTIQVDASEALCFAKIVTAMGISHQKHLGYAVQWFMLAGVIVIYYFLNLRRKELKVSSMINQ